MGAVMVSNTHAAGARPWVVAVTLPAGAAALAFTLRLEPGDDTFVLGALAMAAIWALGAAASAPLPWRGRGSRARTLAIAGGMGAGAVLLCLAAGAVVLTIPALADPVADLLAHRSSAPIAIVLGLTALNGVAEEMFFRGALYSTLDARTAWLSSTALYALVVTASGVLLLTAAAVLLGVLTGLLRRATGGLIAPMTAHLVWSTGMLLLLPVVLPQG